MLQLKSHGMRTTAAIWSIALLLLGFTLLVSGFQSRVNDTPSTTVMRSTSGDGEKAKKEYEVNTFNPLRLMVLRLGFTEPAWTSPLNYQKKDSTYACAYCGHDLFDSDHKYDSGSGWPSYWRTIEEGALEYKMEFDGRLECRCGKCSSHLGHVFLDGPKQDSVPEYFLNNSPESDPRGRSENSRLPRFCINGASLRVKEKS